MTKKFNQFDAFGTILKGKELPKNKQTQINSYLMLRWLSGDQRTIHAANQVNRYYDIPVDKQYQMFRQMLHGKLRFIRYPRGAKSSTNTELDLIQKHYNVNLEKATEMHELISKEELKYLKTVYS